MSTQIKSKYYNHVAVYGKVNKKWKKKSLSTTRRKEIIFYFKSNFL